MIVYGRKIRRNILLSDDQLLSIQTTTMNWIKHKGCIDFLHSRKTIEDVAHSLSIDIGNRPSAEYAIIYPLYQVGILEYGKIDKGIRLFPCTSELNTKDGRWYYSSELSVPRYKWEKIDDKEASINGESFFKTFPPLKSCILNWREQHITNFEFYYNFIKHRLDYLNEVKPDFGIYKQSDNAWVDSYFRISDADYLIPSYSENPEAIRIARSYGMAAKGIKLFEYTGQRLKCLHYSDLPVPIIRGLLISAPDNLLNDNLYHYQYQMEFEGIPKTIVKQLERIFSIAVI